MTSDKQSTPDKEEGLRDKEETIRHKEETIRHKEEDLQDIEETIRHKEEDPQDKEEDVNLQRYNPNKLKPHPKNIDIYGKEKVDQQLVESIRKNGQLEPIVITQDLTIISGHRRWKAIKKIKEEKLTEEDENIEAICFKRHFNSDLEKLEAIIEFNRQREKKVLQIYNEVKILYEIFNERAKLRQSYNLPSIANEADPSHREEIEKDSGRSIEKVSPLVGVKSTKLKIIMRIGKMWDEGDPDAIGIMDEMNDGKIFPDAADKKLKIIKTSKSDSPLAEEAKKLVNRMEKGLSANQATEQLKKYDEKLKNPKPKASGILPDMMFNVIVADPQDMKKAKMTQITLANDAALYLWANIKNITERMELMAMWGFELKNIAVWKKSDKSVTYFRGEVEFLLFGIKGDFEPEGSKEAPPELVFEDHQHRENKSEVVYEMAEKMYPGQKYCDPYFVNGREGWIQPTFAEVKEVELNHEDIQDDEDTNEVP